MTGTTPPEEAPQRLDALRRRLYDRDATEDDLRRYASERDALAPAEPEADPVVVTARRTRFLLPAAVVAVLVASVAGIALTTGPRTPSPREGSVRSHAADLGAGLPTTPSGSVVHEPASRTTSADGTALVSQRFSGAGAAVVPLDLATASFDGGRAVVTLTTSRPSPIAWRAIRLRTRRDWSSYLEVVARSPATAGTGIPLSTATPYSGAPPAWIAVDTDTGSRWTLVVVFLHPIAKHPSCSDLRSCAPG